MKKTYHLCLSAGDEVMFRDLEDYNRGFNSFALALYKTDSDGLVESFMSNHCHLLLQTRSPKDFMFSFRMLYSMYFNRKYERSGKLGEKSHFTMEVVGYHHTVAAASYTLRNALHHGVAPIPYAYPFCSANAIFRKAMGKWAEERLLPQKLYYKHLGKTAEYPDRYKMTESGVFLRESVLDIPQVENLFVTPRMFNFYMSRKSSEEWEAEQKKDQNNALPINIASIESGVRTEPVEKLLIFENGKADYRKISDIDLCTEIDKNILPRYERHPYIIYPLQRNRILLSTYTEKCISVRRKFVDAWHYSDTPALFQYTSGIEWAFHYRGVAGNWKNGQITSHLGNESHDPLPRCSCFIVILPEDKP